MKIPKQYTDLRRFVLRKQICRVLGFLLWIAVFVGGAVMYNIDHDAFPPERLILGWRLWLWIAASVVSGFLIFRMRRVFFDNSCIGTVTHTRSSQVYTNSSAPTQESPSGYDFRTHTILLLQLPNGKRRRLRFEQKNGFYLYYHEGEQLAKLHGLPYPVNTDPLAPHGFVCAACGTWRQAYASRCDICGLSIIDPKELKTYKKKS